MVEVTATFTDEAFALLKKYADEKGLSSAELLRRTMLDWIEDEEDIRDAEAICRMKNFGGDSTHELFR